MASLVVLLLVTAAAATRPCPNNSSIYPCTCTTENTSTGAVHMNMDCSPVTSNTLLQSVFSASFPENNFWSLTINPTTPHPALNTLSPYVFGEATFVHVFIDSTYIQTVHEEAFSASHTTLTNLTLTNNRISEFPFETMASYLHLRNLSLSYNKLFSLPNLESSSLEVLDLSFNTGLTFTEDTLKGTPQLEYVYLHDMGFSQFPANVFSTLKRLKVIDLSKNTLKGKLEQAIFRVPLDSVEEIRLNNNHISDIASTAITGVHRTATIDFSNNNIVALEWDDWYPLLDQLTGVEAVDLTNNPLKCWCDIVWLMLDKDELDKISDKTTCSNGILMKNVDIDAILISC